MPSNQQQIIEQAKFTYSPFGKAFEKQTKTTEDPGEKQVNALKSLESSDKQLPSIKDFISTEMILENLKQYVFGNEIRNNIINMSMTNDKQNQLLRRINEFKSQTRPQNSESKK